MMHSTYSAGLLACNKAGRSVHASNLRSIAEYRKQLFSRFTRTTANRETVAHKFLARLAGSRNGNEVFVWLRTPDTFPCSRRKYSFLRLLILLLLQFISSRLNRSRFTGAYMWHLFHSVHDARTYDDYKCAKVWKNCCTGYFVRGSIRIKCLLNKSDVFFLNARLKLYLNLI